MRHKHLPQLQVIVFSCKIIKAIVKKQEKEKEIQTIWRFSTESLLTPLQSHV